MTINDIVFTATLDDILDELQSQLQINAIPLLQKRKSTVDNVMVSCPYHKDGQESKPSFGILTSNGLGHCFTCGKVATLQQVISHCFGHTDDIVGAFGWNWLLKNFLTISVEERKDVEIDFMRDSRSISRNNAIMYITEQELDSYRYTHPYMYERKLNDEIIELFDIGYDSNTKCITFPIRDIYGNCLFVARRSVHSKFFNYPEGSEKPVYGLYELLQMSTKRFKELFPSEFTMDSLIICESMIDALTCWVYGKPAVALNGLGNELQFRQLRELPFREYVLATDNDVAGMSARAKIVKNVPNKLFYEYIFPSDKKDINDLTQQEFDNLKKVLYSS